MFKELYEVARHTPFTMIITPAGERLSIIIQPRPTGDADDRKGLAAPIKAVGTPEELDAELPAKLREYAEQVNEVRAQIELPTAAVDAEKATTSKKAARKATRAEKKKAAKDAKEAKKTAAKKAQAEKLAKKQADDAERKRKKDAKKSGKKIELPGASSSVNPAPTWPFPTGEKAAAKPATPTAGARSESVRAGLPGKAECIKDYEQLKLKFGDKLTRLKFIKKASTGRRYERLWKNWEEFVKDATAQGQLPLEAGADKTSKATPKADAEPKGEGDHPEPRSPEPAPTAGAAAEPKAEPQPAPKPKFQVFTESDELVAEFKWPVQVGEKLQLEGRAHPFKVLAVDGERAVARAILPTRNRLVDHASGELLGHTEEIYELADQVAELEPKDYRVLRVELDAYAVKLTKPRITGPAAVATTQE